MSKPRVDYAAHEEAYRLFRSQGREGWDTAEGTEKTLREWVQALENKCVPSTGKALELGCGAGDVSLLLAKVGYEVFGVDISPTAIEWAREKAVACGLLVSFGVGNVLNLKGYTDEAFDLVVDGHCLHCIIGDDRSAFLKAARRVLRQGGVLIVKTMCGEPAMGWAREHFDPKSRCVIRDDGLVIRFLGMPQDILTELRGSGFRSIDWQVLPAVSEDDQETLLVYAAK